MRRQVWSRLTGALVAGLGLAALPLGVALPAQALDACTIRTLSQPFTAWGDTNNYFPVTSGTFEYGTIGWSLGAGTYTVAENEPWQVTGAGTSSLKIGAGSLASTPEMCLTPDEDSLRFFYKSPGNGESLSVTIRAKNPVQNVTYTISFTLPGAAKGWQLSPRIALPDVRLTAGTENVLITFRSTGTAAWQLDDVFVDPSRTR
jgi:hypothetical protein